jgi:hypothetical protein
MSNAQKKCKAHTTEHKYITNCIESSPSETTNHSANQEFHVSWNP